MGKIVIGKEVEIKMQQMSLLSTDVTQKYCLIGTNEDILEQAVVDMRVGPIKITLQVDASNGVPICY